MAKVQWYKPHRLRNFYGYPVEVWDEQVQLVGPATFMPIQRIRQQFVAAWPKINGECILAVSPIPLKVYF
jgi:hypothetical protein